MAGERVERRLAAVLAADVAGYSRLMGADEVGTLEALKGHRREVIDPAIAANHGRIVKTTGDGMLVEFASAVDAVTCAMGIQEQMAERGGEIRFRIGINIGDIISDGDDIFGDGVNVAARVESECEPGGVSLSGHAYEQVRGKTAFVFDDLGEKALKNIDRPVRIYAARFGSVAPQVAAVGENKLLPLPDKPSIAVLPFQNMSGDPEQEYFADGMVEEIITALSKFKSLFVIARNSTFTYKGKAVDIKQVGRELGVRYVLEGSVRKAAGRVRITGQLIDATTGAHLWADRFDGLLENIFEVQDDVAGAIVGALDPKLAEAEIARVKRKSVVDLGAYDFVLRAMDQDGWTTDGTEEALRLLYRAIELDPTYAEAYARATWPFHFRGLRGLVPDERLEAERLAREAARLGKDDGFALTWAGFTIAAICGDLQEGAALIDRALELNPNLARTWGHSGYVRLWLDQPDSAIKHFERAMRLSPLDSAFIGFENGTASAHFRAGRYDEASQWAEKALRRRPYAGAAYVLTMSRAAAGDIQGAKRAAQRLLQIEPRSRISTWTTSIAYLSDERRARYAQLLHQAGLPE